MQTYVPSLPGRGWSRGEKAARNPHKATPVEDPNRFHSRQVLLLDDGERLHPGEACLSLRLGVERRLSHQPVRPLLPGQVAVSEISLHLHLAALDARDFPRLRCGGMAGRRGTAVPRCFTMICFGVYVGLRHLKSMAQTCQQLVGDVAKQRTSELGKKRGEK